MEGKDYRSLPLKGFFSRLQYLASERLYTITQELRINEAVSEKAWQVFTKVMVMESNELHTDNLDRVILCSIFMAAKPTSSKVSFKVLLQAYL